MRKKRSVGITVFAALFVLNGIMGLLSVMFYYGMVRPGMETSFDPKMYKEIIESNNLFMSAEELKNIEATIESLLENMKQIQSEFMKSRIMHITQIGSGLISVLILALGIGLFQLREWARKTTILLHILFVPGTMIFMYVYLNHIFGIMEKFISVVSEIKVFLPAMLIVFGVIMTLMAGTVLFYLTRPKIKGMFV